MAGAFDEARKSVKGIAERIDQRKDVEDDQEQDRRNDEEVADTEMSLKPRDAARDFVSSDVMTAVANTPPSESSRSPAATEHHDARS